MNDIWYYTQRLVLPIARAIVCRHEQKEYYYNYTPIRLSAGVIRIAYYYNNVVITCAMRVLFCSKGSRSVGGEGGGTNLPVEITCFRGNFLFRRDNRSGPIFHCNLTDNTTTAILDRCRDSERRVWRLNFETPFGKRSVHKPPHTKWVNTYLWCVCSNSEGKKSKRIWLFFFYFRFWFLLLGLIFPRS